MILGKNDDEKRELVFSDGHIKIIPKDEYLQLLKAKIDALTDEEYDEFHFNIEAKRTGHIYPLFVINKELIAWSK